MAINNGRPEHTKDKFSFGRISRAPANFITARRLDLKCSGRWGGILRVGAAGVREGREKEEEEDGEETPRSPHPTYPTAIYSRLPEVSQQHHLAPHALSRAHNPPPRPKVRCWTLCRVLTQRQDSEVGWPTPRRGSDRFGHRPTEPWLCCWMALQWRLPTSACSAAGLKGGGRDAQSAKVCHIAGHQYV